MKAERVEDASEEKFETNRGRFLRLKERSYHHNTKVQAEAVSADVEATAYYSKDLAKIIKESGYTKHQVFMSSLERSCHLGLS